MVSPRAAAAARRAKLSFRNRVSTDDLFREKLQAGTAEQVWKSIEVHLDPKCTVEERQQIKATLKTFAKEFVSVRERPARAVQLAWLQREMCPSSYGETEDVRTRTAPTRLRILVETAVVRWMRVITAFGSIRLAPHRSPLVSEHRACAVGRQHSSVLAFPVWFA
jgi:hypothetical protein